MQIRDVPRVITLSYPVGQGHVLEGPTITADGKARMSVVEVNESPEAIVAQDWQLDPGADVTIPVAADHEIHAYVVEGIADIGLRIVREGQLAMLGPGDAVRMSASTKARLLLVASAR